MSEFVGMLEEALPMLLAILVGAEGFIGTQWVGNELPAGFCIRVGHQAELPPTPINELAKVTTVIEIAHRFDLHDRLNLSRGVGNQARIDYVILGSKVVALG